MTLASNKKTIEAASLPDVSEHIDDLILEALRNDIVSARNLFLDALSRNDKDYLRELHLKSRDALSSNLYNDRLNLYRKHSKWFIDGSKLNPYKIKPKLILVKANSKEEELFRVVRQTWSIPFSKGYGRRLRFLVIDEYHESLIGIIGMQSPPADLSCRDTLFEFPPSQKLCLINQTMDVYSLGAIPPYSFLLGGKLVAGLVSSMSIRNAYWRQYASKRTEIDDKLITQPLVAATTTSAFGRSSIYNRLKYNNYFLAEPIGYTKGYGLIHLEELYDRISYVVKANGFNIKGGFGNGPKLRWQVVARALRLLNLPSNYLEHGLGREVFLFRFFDDLENGMSGGNFGNSFIMTEKEYSDYWTERWLTPRIKTNSEWYNFSSKQYFEGIFKPKV